MRAISRWTIALAVVALAGLPATAAAQQPQPQDHHRPEAARPVTEKAPEHHLRQAKQALDQIEKEQLEPQARQQVQQLRQQLTELDQAYREKREAREEWMRQYREADQLVTQLIGPEMEPERPEPEREVVGTVGIEETEARTKLEEVRRHLKKFETAATAPETRPSPSPAPTPTPTPDPTARPEQQPPHEQPPPTPTPEPTAPPPDRPAVRPEPEVEPDTPEHHIAQIERLLNQAIAAAPPPDRPVPTVGPGQVCVDRATLEQMRTHLNQLRESLNDTEQRR